MFGYSDVVVDATDRDDDTSAAIKGVVEDTCDMSGLS